MGDKWSLKEDIPPAALDDLEIASYLIGRRYETVKRALARAEKSEASGGAHNFRVHSLRRLESSMSRFTFTFAGAFHTFEEMTANGDEAEGRGTAGADE